jgi:hypothetical protein
MMCLKFSKQWRPVFFDENTRGEFFKEKLAPSEILVPTYRNFRAYATVAPGSVGAYA